MNKKSKHDIGLALGSFVFEARELLRKNMGKIMDKKTAAPGKIYDFTVKTIAGEDKPLADYKGQVFLIVNTASLCGYTPQYNGLEKLYRKFSNKGLKILAFPANEFGKQEPGTNAEIETFCRTQYSVSFDLFSKIVVKGDGIHPLYLFLTTESGHNGAISWNFTKFLVNRQGAVIGRFGPQVEPLDEGLVKKVEEALASV